MSLFRFHSFKNQLLTLSRRGSAAKSVHYHQQTHSISRFSTIKKSSSAETWKEKFAGTYSSLREDSASAEKFYDELSVDYDNVYNDWHWDTPDICVQLVNKHLAKTNINDNKKPLNIYDCGCGTGWVAKKFHDISEIQHRFYGTDIAEGAMKLAKDTNAYVDVQSWNLHKIPFPFTDDFFDVIVCSGVFSYINNKSEVFSEWTRIAKPGALICVSHRTDWLFGDTQQRTEKKDILLFEQMVDDGKWELVEHSPPYPYLTGNDNYSSKNVTAEYLLHKVLI